ncbi:amidohydrolase family protein [Aerophototrophica crusticola]|uniref:Amidohydrolase family protein n=1 Tax=Aerophototrophica crusticola TaxID=1709002 RepID=A0A858R5L1_9PROT|nr:amidohydrolase family protein [Rhodospirillaceae bacterium B3]
MRAALLATALTLGALPAGAQTVMVTADRMLDVQAGRYLEKPALLVRDGRIVEVGTQGQLAAPADTEIVNLAGLTILPGLIDMHVHLTGRHDMHGFRRLEQSPVDEAINGVVHAERTLKAGFTTARNVGAGGYADVALKKAIDQGRVPGPRLWVSGPSIGATGGHCDNNLLPPRFQAKGDGVADGPWGVTQKVRENHKYGATLVKVCATGGVMSKGTAVGAQQLSDEELRAIVEEAKRLGLRTAAHAHGVNGVKAAIRAGFDTIEHASFIDDEGLRLAKERGTWLSMDIYNTEYILGEGEKAGILPESLEKERLTGRIQRENFGRAVKAGVNIVFGSDAGIYPHGENAKQFSRMVKFGMTPLQAIQAATVNAAKALGAEEEVGALAVGRYADILAVKGDPLADISVLERAEAVVKGGVRVK